MSYNMSCKRLRDRLPDLISDPLISGRPEMEAHLASCAACKLEYAALQRTFDLLDLWIAPEPSQYFNQRMAVLVREEQSSPKLGWLGRWRERLILNTGRQLRPVLAGAFALLLLAGGGSVLHFTSFNHANAQTSAAVNDLQILDKNDQTIQQMDQLLQDEGSNQTGPPAQPAS